MSKIEQVLERAGLGRGSPVRRVVIGIIGTTILVIGVALIVLPGPAFIVIPVGLAILASEFIWARRVLERGRVFVSRIRGRRKEPAK